MLDAITGRIPHLQVFGDDYPTPDGAIRDYIHVADLADAHVLGLKMLLAEGGGVCITSSVGSCVQHVIESAKAVTGRDFLGKVAPRRSGDPPVLVASAEKARRELGWKPRYPELRTMLRHAWGWHQTLYDN